jgi:S-methylmethionine-dependent homocysteine/selenocysteine methylase
MTAPVTPAQLLDVARQLCATPAWSAQPWTTRAVALLVRQAVEMWLAQYWDATAPGVMTASRKAQLLLLNARLSEADAAEAHATWSQLSHACHHRVFDLEPTTGQALQWIAQAERIGATLMDAHARAR